MYLRVYIYIHTDHNYSKSLLGTIFVALFDLLLTHLTNIVYFKMISDVNTSMIHFKMKSEVIGIRFGLLNICKPETLYQ